MSVSTLLVAFGGAAPSQALESGGAAAAPGGWRLSLTKDADRHSAFDLARLRRAAVAWVGGPTIASTGETVTVYVSASLAPDSGTPQSWANYFVGLLHGAELGSVNVYVATLAEVQDLCGGGDVVGCYGSSTLVTIGESQPYISREEVTSHEYGHHVAANRDNSPWRAIAWGTKRWATAANVCARAANASVFPGDEGDRYRLNPGEGFAEVYRAVNESRQGTTSFSWPIVDMSFYPDSVALQAAEADVLQPWVQPPASTFRARFTPKGKKAWSLAVATPLDGLLTARLVLPQTRPYKLELLAGDRKTVLARGSWSSARSQTLTFTVCGQRSLLLRVTRGAQAGQFSVTLTKP